MAQPSKSWFMVFNNPCEIITYEMDSDNNYILDKNNDKIVKSREPSEYAGMEPRDICKRVLAQWCEQSETRTGACAYCISAKGLPHLHIVLEDVKTFRFSAVKKLFPRAHIEPTRGNKKQAEDYINKVGSWAEKGEEVVCIEQIGEIKGSQGNRTDLEEVSRMLDEGMTPKQIIDKDMRFLKQEHLIRKAFFYKKVDNAPLERKVDVYYHVGLSGSGKSHSYVDLCNKYGRYDVFLVSDYGTGFLDGYQGEKVLFLDEFRGQIPFSLLLTILQGYIQQFHARYNNIWGLWEEVHITTVLPLETLYKRMVYDDYDIDNIEQLKRRISKMIYHYKKDVSYLTYECDIQDYVTYSLMVDEALGKALKWQRLNEKEVKQIELMFEENK